MIRYKYLDCSVPVDPAAMVTEGVSSSILSRRNDIAIGPKVSSTPKKLLCSKHSMCMYNKMLTYKDIKIDRRTDT